MDVAFLRTILYDCKLNESMPEDPPAMADEDQPLPGVGQQQQANGQQQPASSSPIGYNWPSKDHPLEGPE